MRRKKLWEKAALLCCGYGMMSDAVIVPLTTAIWREFPDASEVLINFIIGGSFLFSLVSALITGRIIHRFDKKKVLFFGTLVYSAASLGSAFATSAAFIAVTRAIDGLTDGVVGVAVVLAINELFADPRERNNMVGLHWTAVSFYGVVLSLLSGVLCVYSWRASLFSNVLSFLTPLLIWLYVPAMPPREKTVSPAPEVSGADEKLPWSWIALSLTAALVLNCLSNVFYFTADFYVAERSLGGSALTGVIASMSTVGGVTGIFFERMYRKLKGWFPVLLFAGAGAGTAVLSLPIGVLTICIFHVVIGSTYTLGLSFYQTSVVERIHSDKNAQVLSYFDIISYIGLAAAPYVPMTLAGLTGGESFVRCFIPISMVLLLFAVIYTGAFFADRRKA